MFADKLIYYTLQVLGRNKQQIGGLHNSFHVLHVRLLPNYIFGYHIKHQNMDNQGSYKVFTSTKIYKYVEIYLYLNWNCLFFYFLILLLAVDNECHNVINV